MIDVGAAILTALAQALIGDSLLVGDPEDLEHKPVVIPKNNIRPMFDNSETEPGPIVVFGFTTSGLRPTPRQDKFEGSLIVQVQSPKDITEVQRLFSLVAVHLNCSSLSSAAVAVHLFRETPNSVSPIAPKGDMYWKNLTFKVLAVRK